MNTLNSLIETMRATNPALAETVAKVLEDYWNTVGAALPIEQQYFVLGRGSEIPAFLKTPGGQAAVRAFVNAWLASYAPTPPGGST